MKSALILNERSCQKQKPQEQLLPLSPPASPQKLTLEDISPIWTSRLKKENTPTFLSLTCLLSECPDNTHRSKGRKRCIQKRYRNRDERRNRVGRYIL